MDRVADEVGAEGQGDSPSGDVIPSVLDELQRLHDAWMHCPHATTLRLPVPGDDLTQAMCEICISHVLQLAANVPDLLRIARAAVEIVPHLDHAEGCASEDHDEPFVNDSVCNCGTTDLRAALAAQESTES